MARRSKRLGLGLLVLLSGCGSSNDGDLFGGSGGSAGGGAIGGGGSAGSVATGGSGGTSGVGAMGGYAGSQGGTSGVGGSGALGGAGGAGAQGGTGGVGGSGAQGGAGGVGAQGGAGGSGAQGGAGGVGAQGGAGGIGGVGGGPAGFGGTGGSGAISGTGTVDCAGNDDCDLAGSFCCMYLNGPVWTPSCQQIGKTCSPGADISCDGPEDCGAGEVCCGQQISVNGQIVYSEFSCEAEGTCNVNEGERIICGQDASVCTVGTTCKPSTILPVYNVCSTN